jgi:hypothetical protein
MTNSDWISLVVFGAFAFFGILLPWLGKRQPKWQRNLPPRDAPGQGGRYEEPEAEPENGSGNWPEEVVADEPPVVWQPKRRPQPAQPVPVPRPIPAATRQARPPSPAVLAARAQARAPQPPRPRRNVLIRNRADARRGITLMAVLGPCRAVDPYR